MAEVGFEPAVRNRFATSIPRPARPAAQAVRIIACIEDPLFIQTILDHLKTKDKTCKPFPLPESRSPPGALFGWRHRPASPRRLCPGGILQHAGWPPATVRIERWRGGSGYGRCVNSTGFRTGRVARSHPHRWIVGCPFLKRAFILPMLRARIRTGCSTSCRQRSHAIGIRPCPLFLRTQAPVQSRRICRATHCLGLPPVSCSRYC